MKALIVSFYFPPAGGGGVQRPLKLAQYLPAMGIETHVLAPDDPRWLHRDDGLRMPTQAWVHRARYVGVSGGKPSEVLAGTDGIERALTQARLQLRRLVAARRERDVGRRRRSPPGSGSSASTRSTSSSPRRRRPRRTSSRRRSPGRRAPAGSPTSATRSSRTPIGGPTPSATKAKAATHRRVAQLVASRADAITCVSEAISEETRALDPRGPVVTIPNGCDFDDVVGLERSPSDRFRLTHTGSFFGRRDPRPFLQALSDSGLDVVTRFLGDFREADRQWAEGLELGDRLELIPYAPRSESLALQRDSEALLLLIPEADGRGKGVLSGKVFEYIAVGRPILAVVPPDGAAAELIRETDAGVVAPPDDPSAIRAALDELHARWRDGGLPDVELTRSGATGCRGGHASRRWRRSCVVPLA